MRELELDLISAVNEVIKRYNYEEVKSLEGNQVSVPIFNTKNKLQVWNEKLGYVCAIPEITLVKLSFEHETRA